LLPHSLCQQSVQRWSVRRSRVLSIRLSVQPVSTGADRCRLLPRRPVQPHGWCVSLSQLRTLPATGCRWERRVPVHLYLGLLGWDVWELQPLHQRGSGVCSIDAMFERWNVSQCFYHVLHLPVSNSLYRKHVPGNLTYVYPVLELAKK